MFIYVKRGVTSLSIFSDNLIKYRKQADISRKELASILKVSVTSIGFYETGRNEPDLQKLVAIAAALHVSLDDLLGYHVDEYYKAAALFQAATGKRAVLENNAVSIHTDKGIYSRWKKPISKAGFIKAIEESANDFDKNLRPKLLKSSINSNLDKVYRNEWFSYCRNIILRAIHSSVSTPDPERIDKIVNMFDKDYSIDELSNLIDIYLESHPDALKNAAPEGDDDKTSDPTKEN